MSTPPCLASGLQHRVGAVIHFAALKAVGQSLARPLDYYLNNVGGTAALLRVRRAEGEGRYMG